jgi:hypothetical protein
MAFDLNSFLNSASLTNRLGRTGARTYNQGDVWVDQEGGTVRGPDGEKGDWDPNLARTSFYLGGAPWAGGQQIQLWDNMLTSGASDGSTWKGAEDHFSPYLKEHPTLGKYITQNDYGRIAGMFNNGEDAVERYGVPMAMTAMGLAAGGAFGNLSTYGSAGGTFGTAAAAAPTAAASAPAAPAGEFSLAGTGTGIGGQSAGLGLQAGAGGTGLGTGTASTTAAGLGEFSLGSGTSGLGLNAAGGGIGLQMPAAASGAEFGLGSGLSDFSLGGGTTGYGLGGNAAIPAAGGGAAASGGFWGDLFSSLTQPTGGGSGGNIPGLGSPLSRLFGGLLEAYGSNQAQGQTQDLMRQLMERADPFASQRPFYQDQLKQSYTDPNFFANNAQFQGIKNLALSDTQAMMNAKGYGGSGNMLHAVGSRLQDEAMKFALPWQAQTGQFAGANVNPANSAQIGSQLGQQGISYGQDTLAGIGYGARAMTNQIPNVLEAANKGIQGIGNLFQSV